MYKKSYCTSSLLRILCHKKGLNIMKISVLLLFAVIFSVSAKSYAQEARVTFDLKNVSVNDVFNTIRSQTSYSFWYDLEDVDASRIVSVKAKDQEVKEVLNVLFKNKDVNVQMVDNHIVIKSSNSSYAPPIAQQKKRKVTGVVSDAMGTVIGANIIEKGTTNGVVTDMDGKYTLEVSENAILQVSYIGYIEQNIAIKNRGIINILMREDTQALDEVVVVGYGTMKKKDLTGAVSSIKMADSPVTTVSTISHALAGKAAGLQVNTISAQPGGGVSFRIRGAASVSAGNEPLIVIDGFPVTDPGSMEAGRYKDGTKDNILSSINPNDIESIEVLKDASSTAIYGSRAGNGVILITTKKGKSGNTKVSYSGTATVQQISKNYEMLNASQFMTESNRYQKEDWMRVNKIGPYGNANASSAPTFTPQYSDEQIANPINNTDWIDAVTQLGFQTQHNVSMSGGTDKNKYLVSLNYFKQDGVVQNNTLERYTGRINLEQKISKTVTAGVNATFSRNEYDNVPLGGGQAENASILVSAAQFNPLIPIKDKNGDYPLNENAAFLPNPVSLLEITDQTRKERVLASAFIEIAPIKELKLKANVGIDRNYQKRKVYLPTSTLYGQKEGGRADLAQSDKSDYLLDLTANYNKIIGTHQFSALAGYSFQSFHYEGMGSSNNQFLTDGFLFNNIGAGASPKPGVWSSASKDEMASFFGRVNYSFMDKYLITGTLRADGASNFSKNNRWGYFPSISTAWRFAEESFMEPFRNIISNGKLRLSYGTTGNSNIGNKTSSHYKVGNNNEFGDSEYNGVFLEQMGNNDLKWETTKEVNIGLDLGFFKNRLNITAEYYDKEVSDLLSTRNLLSYHEVGTIAANIGKTQSKGFELTINSQNIVRNDFSWSSDITFSFYRDKWKERAPTWRPAIYDIYDAPIRGDYGYLSDGLIQVGDDIKHMPGSLPGQVKIKDIDGYNYNTDGSIKVDEHGQAIKTGVADGKLDDADKVFYGSWDPSFLFGFNNTLNWKDFDFNIYFYGQRSLHNGSYKDNMLIGAQGVVNMYRGYNMPTTAQDVWTHENQSASRPGYFTDRSTWGTGDFYMEDIWFLRCRNITLGYSLPKKEGNKVFSNMRIYLDVNNPFVLTNYDGLDPETDNSSWAYPNVTSCTIGLDITF